MHLLAVIQTLALMTVANGVPVIAKKLLDGRFAWPLDCGLVFLDGRPLLGASKTLRGIILALVVTAVSAPLVGVEPTTGAIVAASAMVGDLSSSFIKRRLAMVPSSRALGLDQIPESLFPLLAGRAVLPLTISDILLGVALFLIGEIALSRLLYRVHLRDQPY